MFRDWFVPPDPAADPAVAEYERYRQTLMLHSEPLDRWFLCYAQTKYDDMQQSIVRLDDKADKLIHTAATITAVVFAAVGAWGLTPIVYAIPAAVCYLAAIVFALLSRLPVKFAKPPRVPDLLDAIRQVPAASHHEWLAHQFGVAAEHARVYRDWKARAVWRAAVLLVAAVVATIGLFFMRPPLSGG